MNTTTKTTKTTKPAAEVTKLQQGQVTIPLSRPLEVDGAKLSSLTMREPTVDDQMNVEGQGTDAEQEVALIANLCMMTPADVRRLPLRDFGRVKAAFMGFLD